jgi:hypothetical protein
MDPDPDPDPDPNPTPDPTLFFSDFKDLKRIILLTYLASPDHPPIC